MAFLNLPNHRGTFWEKVNIYLDTKISALSGHTACQPLDTYEVCELFIHNLMNTIQNF